MIKDIYNTLLTSACSLEGFKPGCKEDVEYDIDVLANGYVEARNNKDEVKMNQYISALMIRYWHMVPHLYETSKTLRVELEDMVSWLYEALEKAFKYCSWLDESKPISKDPRGAEKCINQCITSVRQWWFKHLNQDKRKINAMTYSLNTPCSDESDNSLSLLDIQSDGEADKDEIFITEAVDFFLKKGEIFNALIIDGIINQGTFTEKSYEVPVIDYDEEGNEIESTRTVCDETFSSVLLFKHLKNMDDKFIKYFENRYDVEHESLKEEVEKISSYTPVKLRNKISKSFENMKSRKEVLQLLCY